MAHPINSLEYLIDEWKHLKNRYSYYAFFLFTEDNVDFAKLFSEMMVRWDDISGDGTMFFAIAPPPDGWNDIAKERGYWQHFKANSESEISYDSDAVRQVGRYFNVPDSSQPNVVVFSDLKRTDTLTIQLNGLSTEENQNYIENIFRLLNNPTVRRYRDLWRIQPLLDLLPTEKSVSEQWIHGMIDVAWKRDRRVPYRNMRRGYNIRGDRVTLNNRVVRHDSTIPLEQTLQSINQEMQRLSNELSRLRREQREQFENVNISLERIESVLGETIKRIERYRGSFVERWLEAEYAASNSIEIASIRSRLTENFDKFIIAQGEHLVRRIRATMRIPQELAHFDNILEPNSRVALETSEALWDYLSRSPNEQNTEFSVCGIGLWKTLEIELNRTFVDALRVHRGVTSAGTQSTQQLVYRTSNINEQGFFGGQGYKNIRLNQYTDNDPANDPTQLKGVMLGQLAALLQGIDRNNLDSITSTVTVHIASTDTSRHDFFRNVGSQVQGITNHYRNSHAHMRQMDRGTYEAFRTTFLDSLLPHSPLFRTLEIKDELNRRGLI